MLHKSEKTTIEGPELWGQELVTLLVFLQAVPLVPLVRASLFPKGLFVFLRPWLASSLTHSALQSATWCENPFLSSSRHVRTRLPHLFDRAIRTVSDTILAASAGAATYISVNETRNSSRLDSCRVSEDHWRKEQGRRSENGALSPSPSPQRFVPPLPLHTNTDRANRSHEGPPSPESG